VPQPEIVFDTGRTIGLAGAGRDPGPDRADLADLTQHLAGHVRRVDHTGVNLPARSVSPEQRGGLVQDLASTAAMYRYPTGEPWPFILPTTDDEMGTDIRESSSGASHASSSYTIRGARTRHGSSPCGRR
jgi:hypothetical protein